MDKDKELLRLQSIINIQQARITNLLKLSFYANPEKWILRDKHSWRKACPKSHGDSEMISGYEHPNTDWRGTVVVGGKLAREVIQKDLAYRYREEELSERK